jgi:hypothetical protein
MYNRLKPTKETFLSQLLSQSLDPMSGLARDIYIRYCAWCVRKKARPDFDALSHKVDADRLEELVIAWEWMRDVLLLREGQL